MLERASNHDRAFEMYCTVRYRNSKTFQQEPWEEILSRVIQIIIFLESLYEKWIQGPGSLNLAGHQEFGAFFIANSSFERLSYLPGCWVSGSWVPRTSISSQETPPLTKLPMNNYPNC
jgi:hypothetical protein